MICAENRNCFVQVLTHKRQENVSKVAHFEPAYFTKVVEVYAYLEQAARSLRLPGVSQISGTK